MDSSDPYGCLVNESKIIEKQTEQRLQNDHRMDNLILLVYIVLLTLSVITIWAFKHRRFRYIHETGLSVVYGLIVGIILRYAIKSPEFPVESHVFLRKADVCGGHLPPERLVVEVPVRDQNGTLNLSMLFRYKFEQQSDDDSLINDKATFDPEFFFNVLLPPIIFSAGYSMKRGHFFKNIGAVLTYAVGGTLLSSLVVGTLCYGFTRGISSLSQTLYLSDCLLFGAMISATDPVTVLAIFSDLRVDVNLYALVFGESVLNDALAIALAQSVEKYGSLSAGNFDGHALLSSVLNFFIMFGGSFVIGVFIGCVTSLLTKFTHIKEHPLLETTLFVLMSYSTFLFAETVGFTGIVSVLFCGITQAHYTYNNLSSESKVWTKSFFELLNFLSENFVFAYIGVSTFTFRHHYWDVRFVFIALFSCVVARAVSVYPLTGLINFCRTYRCSCSANCLKRKPDTYSIDKCIIPGSSFSSSPVEPGDISVTTVGGGDKRKNASNKITLNFQHMIFFSGLRGAMAFSLAIRNTSSEIRRMFFSTTIVVVVTTVLLGGCFAISLLHRLKIPVGVDCSGENQMHADAEEYPYEDRGCCSSRWIRFDKFYLKPLFTHSTPPLTESLPLCCYKCAKVFTTNEQRNETFVDYDGSEKSYLENSRRESTVFYSHDKATINPTLSVNTVKVQPVKVDWRRSFITTDINPYYDSFVRWQFLTLKKQGKIQYGKRYTIFSARDNQPCMDHERAVGEGVVPQEYTLIKLQVISEFPSQFISMNQSKQPIYLVAATLRPETMFGQTNCWVHPDIEYVAVRSLHESCILICTQRAVQNMAYQGILDPSHPGHIEVVANFKGVDLLGLKVKAPLSSYTDGVYVLPMMSIRSTKGTGVVTSVPSDSPDDWVALRDLKKKPAFREKYNLLDSMVLPFEPVPIIDTPDLGNLPAVTIVDQLKIQSQNDREKLQEAKEKVYRVGFYDGVMLVDKYKGMKVNAVKKLIQDELVKTNQAIIYYEPENLVVTRSGDEAVVALCNQWYLDYGSDEWKSVVRKAIDNLCATDEVRRNLLSTVDWLHEHACSRTYGLGSRLPWDEKWLIESLSDSTIYMAYYTVAHLLQGGSLDGRKFGPLGIKPEHMTPEVWDYIFLGIGTPDNLVKLQRHSSISTTALKRLREEFLFWYPVDLRVSGKDLVPNHLTYYLYNHTAVWPNEPNLWPASIRANGHLLLNSNKMSKSTGNFLTLSDAVDKYSADGIRLALADAGDSLDDANMKEEMAEAGLLRLYGLLDWFTMTLEILKDSTLQQKSNFRTGPYTMHADYVFENEMNHTIESADKAYSAQEYREVLKIVFYELQTHRDRYREVCQGSLHIDLIRRYMDVQLLLLCPICSHLCEYIWLNLLNNKKSIFCETWPKLSRSVDRVLLLQGRYIDDTAHAFRLQLKQYQTAKLLKKSSKSGESNYTSQWIPPSEAIIWVAKAYPPWQAQILEIMAANLSEDGKTLPDNATLAQLLRPHLKAMGKMAKRAMPFVQLVRERFENHGKRVLQLQLEVDECEVITKNLSYLISTLGLRQPDGLKIHYSCDSEDSRVQESVCPLEPLIIFREPSASVSITFLNPDVGSGLFTINSLTICDGDTHTDVISRVINHCRLSMPGGKELKKISLYRFTDPVYGPLRIPPYSPDSLQIIQPTVRFIVDASSYSVNLQVDDSQIPIGTKLIYTTVTS
ncbi:unnamed protein product [Heterobilharzia americana]|nr:unnamed protein product [Heterobilharzia americana]